jgi:hypothetical protein
MKTNYGSLHKIYTKNMYEAKRQSRKNNLPMANDHTYSREDFKYMFDATKEMLISKGKSNPTNREVVEALVAKQQYGSTEAEGRNLVKAMRARGLDIDIKTARALHRYVTEDELARLPISQQVKAKEIQHFFNEIKDYRNLLKSQGFTNDTIQLLVAQTFFGSE